MVGSGELTDASKTRLRQYIDSTTNSSSNTSTISTTNPTNDAAPVLLAVDGGYAYLDEMGVLPDHVIGDMDSMPEELKQKVLSLPEDQFTCLPVEKDDTDMLAAMKYVQKLGITEVILFGGTGGRFDHTFANLQSMLFFKKNGGNVVMQDDQNELRLLSNETVTFQGKEGKRMSLFAITPEVKDVTLKGFHYPLTNAKLTPDYPIGVSNEFVCREASVTVGTGTALLMIEQ